jgi:hypothetical protein
VNDAVRPRPALDIHEESNTQEHLILPLAQLFTRWTFIFLLVTFELFLADRHQAHSQYFGRVATCLKAFSARLRW